MAGERRDGRRGSESGGYAGRRPSDWFAPGAWRYALAGVALAVPAAMLSRLRDRSRAWSLGVVLLGAAALLFHRDPDRTPPESGILAPADGRVSVVREEEVEVSDGGGDDRGGDDGDGDDRVDDDDGGDVGADAGEGTDTRLRIGIFMNVTDVHVNRAPLGGTVEAVEHEPGKHRPAFTKESDRNEKLRIGFPDHEVTLIAGAFARRIHPYVESGDDLDRGERLGHVSFGSRADVLLPASVEPSDVTVERGQTVRAGETVIADWNR